VQEQYNVGQCLLVLGRIDEALERLRAANRIAPTMPEPEIAIAKALLAKKDATREERAEALQLAKKANESTSSKRADVLETLAMASAANSDPASAVALVQQALELPGPTRNAAFRERLMATRPVQDGRGAAGARGRPCAHEAHNTARGVGSPRPSRSSPRCRAPPRPRTGPPSAAARAAWPMGTRRRFWD
jgi:tetratricopeptide (TPR) repeat protein